MGGKRGQEAVTRSAFSAVGQFSFPLCCRQVGELLRFSMNCSGRNTFAGKTEDASCVCDGWTPQNAAHLLQCPWVGDGKGRTREAMMGDESWCEEVARFLL